MSKNQVPCLLDKGRDATRRPDFTHEGYLSLMAQRSC